MATPTPKSSQDSSSDGERKYCSSCNIRMSNVQYDKHVLCVSCRGVDCNKELRCDTCRDWDVELMERYVKHKKSLASRSRPRKEKKDKGDESKDEDASSDGSGVRVLGSVKAKPKIPSLTEDRVVEMISSSLKDFSSSFKKSMSDSFAAIETFITDKFREQDVPNHSISDNPSSVSTHQHSCQVQRDPSLRKSQSGDSGPEIEVEESGQSELANAPSIIRDFVNYSRGQGVTFSREQMDRLLGRAPLDESLFSGVRRSVPRKVGWDPDFDNPRPGTSGGSGNREVPSVVSPDVGAGSGDGQGDTGGDPQSNPVVPDDVGDGGGPPKDPHIVEFSPDDSAPVKLKAIFRLLYELCPDSVPPSSGSSAVKSCDYEGQFGRSAPKAKEELLPTMFHRVREILDETKVRFAQIAEEGKLPAAGLPHRQKTFAIAGHEDLAGASKVNSNMPRLSGDVSTKRSLNLNLDEAQRLEAISHHLIESQNLTFWTFNMMVNWLSEQGFTPSAPDLFEEVIRTHTTSMVRSTSLASSLALYFKAKRREAYLSHFPAHIGQHFKTQLASSSLDSSLLFDPSVLSQVSAESREDSALDAQLTMAKKVTEAVSFPRFGAGRGNRKASSDSSSAAASSNSSFRGRGRGQGFQFQAKKRKPEGKDENPKAPKSPRKSAKSPKGRGFHR